MVHAHETTAARSNRALCAYWQSATLASFGSVVFVLPEAIETARHLLGR